MNRRTMAGAAALLTAPLVAILSALTQPSLSDHAGKQVAGLTEHRDATILALSLNTIAVVLLVAGAIWLALELGRRAPRLALAGGILAVFGSLVVVFENGIAAATPSIVSGLDPAQATATLDRINSSAAVSGLEPLSLLGDIGLAILGFAAVSVGAPRWTAAAVTLGALGEGVGFATGTRTLIIVAFVILWVGLAQAVRTLAARPAPQGLAATALAAS